MIIIREGKKIMNVKARIKIKTSPSLIVAFAVKSLNETVKILKPKAQEAKMFATYE